MLTANRPDVRSAYSTLRGNCREEARHLRPSAAMTGIYEAPARLLAALAILVLVALLIVGLVQLALIHVLEHLGAGADARAGARATGGLARAAGRAARPGEPAAARRRLSAPSPGRRAARLPAGDRQVGLVVRPLPGRARRVSARVGHVRPDGRVPRHRFPRYESRRRARVPERLPGRIPELLRPERPPGHGDHRLAVHAGDGVLRPRRPPSSSSRARFRAPPSSKPTSAATRWTSEPGRCARCPRSA